MSTTLTAGTPYKTANKASTSKVLVQVNIGDTSPLYIFGSLDGTNYVQLETVSASTIKEISACSYISVSATAGDHDSATSVGTSSASIQELSGF